MINLKEATGSKGRIRIEINKEDYSEFLEEAKKQGFLWRNGSVIKPNIDKQSTYTKILVATSELFIYEPVGWIANMSLNSVPIIKYEKLTNKEVFEKSQRTIIKDKKFEDIQKAKEILYKAKCEENKKISKIQLKYKHITSKLQKEFFVHYKNLDELIQLMYLLKEYGYENIENIDIEYFQSDIKIICIDNNALVYYPSNITKCSCMLLSSKKIYEFEAFRRMIKDTFDY